MFLKQQQNWEITEIFVFSNFVLAKPDSTGHTSGPDGTLPPHSKHHSQSPMTPIARYIFFWSGCVMSGNGQKKNRFLPLRNGATFDIKYPSRLVNKFFTKYTFSPADIQDGGKQSVGLFTLHTEEGEMHKSGFVRVKPKLNEGGEKRRQQTPLLNAGEICTGDFPLCFLSCQQPLLRILWETQDLSEKVKIFTRKTSDRKRRLHSEREKKKSFMGKHKNCWRKKRSVAPRGRGSKISSYSISFYGKQPSGWWTKKRRERPPATLFCVVASSYSPLRFSPKKGINGMNHSPFSFFTLFKPLLQF